MTASASRAAPRWPRSLFGRHLLLIAALVVAGQLCAAWLSRQLIFEPRVALAAEGVVRNVTALRAGLGALPPGQREAFVAAFNREAARHAAAPSVAMWMGNDMNGMRLGSLERRFLQAVSARLRQEGMLADASAPLWRRDSEGVLSLRVEQDGAAYWLNLPSLFPARVFTGAWLAATLAGVLLALAGAWWMQRQIHRPLARVVAAARDIAQGAPYQPLPEDGPQEIATVARSVNHMAHSLQEAERERAVMLAGISHDLRTPLTKLRLAAEIARPRMEPALAAGMARSVDEMDAIVGQFLDFARMGEAEPLACESLDALAAAVAEAQADHGRRLALAPGGTPAVPLRPQALRRAVDNLVENAWRHGCAPVTLRTGVAAGGAQAWIEVADSGSGVPQAELARLRQPFARGDAAARSGAPGAGLGLAIAERVARLHGGALELRSPPGAGLHARIVLPASGHGHGLVR